MKLNLKRERSLRRRKMRGGKTGYGERIEKSKNRVMSRNKRRVSEEKANPL